MARNTRWPMAVRKSDGQKMRLPDHIIQSSDGLDYAPSEKNRRETVRVTEPTPNTITTKAPKATTQKES